MTEDNTETGAVVLSLVAPLCREAAVVGEVHERLVAAAGEVGEACEIIYVDDGSGDGTAELVCELPADGVRVRLVELSRPFGSPAAVAAGRRLATGRAVICFEGDRPGDPGVVSELLSQWRRGAEVVYTVGPAVLDSCTICRTVCRVVRWWARWAGGTPPPADRVDAYLLDRRVLDSLAEAQVEASAESVRGIGFRQASVAWGGGELPPATPSLARLLRTIAGAGGGWGLLALRLATGAGAAMIAAAAVLLLLWPLLYLLRVGSGAAGFLTVGLLGVGGGQLIVLGAVGEYACGRTAPGRPAEACVVRRTWGFDADEEPEPESDEPEPPERGRDEILIYT